MEDKRSYYAIIPADVRYDKALPAGAKLLYGEITALSNQNGACWARNRYFADLYGVNEKTVRNWINALVNANYLYSHIQYESDGKTVLQRCLSINKISTSDFPTYGNYFPQGTEENFPTPTEKNCLYNNTSMNNTNEYNFTNRKVEGGEIRKAFIKPTVEEISAYCKERNNLVDAQQFWDFYESKGWRVGNTPMKDWRAALRSWEHRRRTERQGEAKETVQEYAEEW